jgi:hypothetical protein
MNEVLVEEMAHAVDVVLLLENPREVPDHLLVPGFLGHAHLIFIL